MSRRDPSDADLIGVLRLHDDRPAVRLERSYATDAADLWSALTEPARLARWLARVEGDLRVGGDFVVYFDDADPDQQSRGAVLDCRPTDHLRVTWLFPDEEESQVTVDLRPSGDGATMLVLDHRRLPDYAAAGYGAGWQAYLEQLDTEVGGSPHALAWDARCALLLPAYRTQFDDLDRTT
jgi:uncharacterized protein YndB with AHSA1/START domain